MKNILFVILMIGFTASFQSCFQDECTSTNRYVRLDPVYVTVADFRKTEIRTSPARQLQNPGKIYFYQNFLLINEKGRGIHFYDLKDPANPEHSIFYEIDGNFDMSIKDDLLIVDNVIDLISIDISEITNPQIVSRQEDYKNEERFEDQQFISYYNTSNVVEEFDCSTIGPQGNQFVNWGGNFWAQNSFFDATVSVFSTNDVSNGLQSLGGTGIGGSTARFTIYEDFLYTVSDFELSVWDINTLAKYKSQNLGWGVETIFPYKDKMFIGSNSGMFIFDISNPTSPVQLSTFSHARACDPVVVQGETAFVTLRSGSACSGANNQLDVINITDPTNPVLKKTYPMINPHGLSVLNDRLYICEGQSGLKVLDISDIDDVKEINLESSIKATDVIALSDDNVMVIGSDGFYFLNTTNPKNIKVLSQISISL